MGSKRIVDVRRADVARMHAKLSDAPYQANRALELVSAVWNWAARREEVAFVDNPANAIERYPEAGRERYLTSEELARLGDVLREGETIGLPYSIDETKPTVKHAPKADRRRVKTDPFAVAARAGRRATSPSCLRPNQDLRSRRVTEQEGEPL
jgi:hypothetical protein